MLLRFAGFTALLAEIVCILASPLPSLAAEFDLITDSSAATLSNQPESLSFYRSIRTRTITLNSILAQPTAISTGDTFNLNLFPDANYLASVERVDTNINSTVTIVAAIADHPYSYMIISTTGSRSLGSISIADQGKQFLIVSTSPTGSHYLLDLRSKELDELDDAPPLIPKNAVITSTINQEGSVMADVNGSVTIDLLVVYTNAARTWADPYGGIDNVIALAVARGELALSNSNTLANVRLVKSLPTSYNESGSAVTDVVRLTGTTDGYMDDVHTLRNNTGADVVSLFAKIEDVGGAGWLLNTASGRSDLAFNICRVQQVTTAYTTIHEIGHNCGCGHRADQAIQPGPGLFSYSSGWHWTGNDGNLYCSVMSYTDGGYTAVPYFSNPSINFAGAPTGTTYADNARTLRQTKQVVSNYRQIAGPIVIGVSPNSGSNGIGKWITFTATYSHDNSINNLSTLSLLINKTAATSGGCTCIYLKSTNKLYMLNNAGSMVGGYAPGTAKTIETESASLDCSGTTVTTTTKTVTIKWKVLAKPAMVSLSCNIYLKAQDTSGNTTGWVDVGDYKFTGSPPKSGTFIPIAQPEVWDYFTTTYSDGDGASDISICSFLINKTLTNQGGAHFFYDKTTNKLYMKRNDGTVIGGITRGTAGTITSDNAVLDTAGTTVSSAGNTITITWHAKLRQTMSGKLCNTYLKTVDIAGGVDNWSDKGDLAVK